MTVEELWAQYGDSVLWWCMKLTRDADRAEDLRQDVFLRVLRFWDGFNGDSSPLTWLKRVAINQFLDGIRKSKCRYVVDNPSGSSLDAMAEEYGDERQCGALQKALLQEDAELRATGDRSDLQSAWARLSERDKFLLELYELQGFSHAEVASLLDSTEESVKNQTFYARRRLALLLGADVAAPVEEASAALSGLSKYLED